MGKSNQIESSNVHLPLNNLSPNIFRANMRKNCRFNEPMKMHFYRDSRTFGRRRNSATARRNRAKIDFFETSTQPEMQNSLIVIPSPGFRLGNQSAEILESRDE